MILRIDSGKIKRARLKEWHTWFAWYPVRINDHELAWMIPVRRKGERYSGPNGSCWIWEYALERPQRVP